MKIGIGITTTNNRNVKSGVYEKYLSGEYEVHFFINIDYEFEGVASSRNKCLQQLFEVKKCDYVFLFDDDCYPMMYGWDKYIIENAEKNNLGFLGMPSPFKSTLVSVEDEVCKWSSLLGCFSFISEEHFRKVGYYNTKFKKYGYEDVEYHYRSTKVSEENMGFNSLLRIPSYIFSEDAYHRNPSENYSREEKEKYIEINKQILEEEICNDKIYLPYKQ